MWNMFILSTFSFIMFIFVNLNREMLKSLSLCFITFLFYIVGFEWASVQNLLTNMNKLTIVTRRNRLQHVYTCSLCAYCSENFIWLSPVPYIGTPTGLYMALFKDCMNMMNNKFSSNMNDAKLFLFCIRSSIKIQTAHKTECFIPAEIFEMNL